VGSREKRCDFVPPGAKRPRGRWLHSYRFRCGRGKGALEEARAAGPAALKRDRVDPSLVERGAVIEAFSISDSLLPTPDEQTRRALHLDPL
jgi:hypothetical protein